MTYQQPSVGQIVHYVSHGTPVQADGTQAFAKQCRAAIITQVENDTTVGLCVLNPTGLFFHERCFFVGENGPGYDAETGAYPGGTWHWPERV